MVIVLAIVKVIVLVLVMVIVIVMDLIVVVAGKCKKSLSVTVMVVVILNVIVIDTVIAEAIAEVADLARVKSYKMWVFEGGGVPYKRCRVAVSIAPPPLVWSPPNPKP